MANIITNIKERILYISDYQNVKKEKFFEELGLQYGNFKGKAKNTPINSDSLAIIIAKYPDIDINWLLTGEGEMIKASLSGEAQDVYSTRGDNNINSQRIPLYSVEAAAGIVQLFKDSKPTKEFIVIPNLPKCDGSMYITGDSMYPLLKSGDIVAYKQINDIRNYSFIWGEMYIINFQTDGDNYTTIKYIQPCEKDETSIRLVSQNEHHKPITILKQHIRALALVKASIRINGMN